MFILFFCTYILTGQNVHKYVQSKLIKTKHSPDIALPFRLDSTPKRKEKDKQTFE